MGVASVYGGFPNPLVADDYEENLETFLLMRGSDVVAALPDERASLVQRSFDHWRGRGFPFPCVRRKDLERTFERLSLVGGGALETTLARPSTVGLKLANAYSPAIWLGKVRGKSPLECFADDPTLRRGLERAPSMWPSRPCWNAAAIRSLAGLLNRGRLSNFRPTVARAILDRYSERGASVLDFSAGYGGRLLGALSLDRRYLGIEPSSLQAKSLRHLVRDTAGRRSGTAEIVEDAAEEVLTTLPAGRTDLVFTSPPYYNLEKYAFETTQSWIRYPSFGRWLEGFAAVCVEQSHRVLRRGGHLILNLSNTRAFPVADAFQSLASGIFGTPLARHEMMLSTNPNLKSRGPTMSSEGITVWRKR